MAASVNWLSHSNYQEEEFETKQVVAADEPRELPKDAIFEILSWVPLDSINRSCRWVCKDWNKLSYKWEFRKLHNQRTGTMSGYFLQTTDFGHSTFISNVNHSPAIPSPTLDFLPSQFQSSIVASSKSGLLCCASRWQRIPSYYVCKPTTREWKRIPNPRTRFWEVKVGMVVKESNPLHYKLVRLSERKRLVKPGYHCEIFDSNIGMWKRTKDVELPGCSTFFKPREPAVLINNAIFCWLLHYDCEDILAFDIDTESWRLISLPEESLKTEGIKKLEEYKGKLALLYYDWEFLEIWAMEDKDTWKKKKRVDVNVFRQIAGINHPIPVRLHHARLVLMLGPLEVCWFDLKTDRVSSVRLSRDVYEIFPFESDSVPCNLGL